MQGKIIKGISGFYYVEAVDGQLYETRAKGIFRKQNIKPLVGDNVEIEVIDEAAHTGNLISIEKRKNQLIRPLVANVDQAMIIFAIVYPNPSFQLLDRFLILMQRQNIPVTICFNKQDLADKEEVEKLAAVYQQCGCKVIFLSVAREQGIEEVRDALRGKTTVLAGPSGVGKSSLINLLHPMAEMETGELSRKIARGKNTTRHSELFCIDQKEQEQTFLCDTPGFTSLYLEGMQPGQLGEFYPEFTAYEPNCRFGGCSHISEPDCGVKTAVAGGRISKIRYENYKMIYKELLEQKPKFNKASR